jgi:hypothetical protein
MSTRELNTPTVIANSLASVKRQFANFWPPVAIVLAIMLTVVWTGGLLWLVMSII